MLGTDGVGQTETSLESNPVNRLGHGLRGISIGRLRASRSTSGALRCVRREPPEQFAAPVAPPRRVARPGERDREVEASLEELRIERERALERAGWRQPG